MHAETTLEKEVEKVFARKKNCRVLDLGCGEGGALKELKQKFGVRVFVCGIDLLEAQGLDWFVRGRAQGADFPDNVDLVVSFRAMHEFSPLESVLEKVCKGLAGGAKGFLSVRCQQLVGNQLLFHGNLNSRDLDFLKKIINAGEFKGVKVRGVEATETKKVTLVEPATAGKVSAQLRIINGINLFLGKK
jgi:SAM-dependent methyltransferase